MMKIKIALMVLLVFMATACVTHSLAKANVHYGERSELAFTGKGAAAGIMMDAYMGGMGVAIGVAIDEGIAKDIARNLNQYPSGLTITELFEKHLAIASKNSKVVRTLSPVEVIVDKYGFRTAAGEGDLLSSWLEVRFLRDGKEVKITYPDDVKDVKTVTFNTAKTDAKPTYLLLEDAVKQIVDKWVASQAL